MQYYHFNHFFILYFFPVVNAWLVALTWLQHTEVDVPHLPSEGYSFIKGALHTIDRPYDKLLWGLVDFLHHHIGTTHGSMYVCMYVCACICMYACTYVQYALFVCIYICMYICMYIHVCSMYMYV